MLLTVEVHMGYAVTKMLWGQICLPVFQIFMVSYDTTSAQCWSVIRDWCLVQCEAAEPRNSVSLYCYNRLHMYKHTCTCTHIHIPLIHQSAILNLDMKQVTLPCKQKDVYKTITSLSKQVYQIYSEK